jgi:tRNA (cytidine/uridine-2'-O-)-methyltransferase
VFHVILVAPEIPPNTGNAIRLCANTGCSLHLVEPLGFDLSDAQLRRAGLDYAEMTCVTVHADWAACRTALGEARLFALTTKASRRHASASFNASRTAISFISVTSPLIATSNPLISHSSL